MAPAPPRRPGSVPSMSRHDYPEHGVTLLLNFHVDPAVMGADDLLGDIQTEAEPVARALVAAAERIEQVGQEVRRDGAGVCHREPHLVAVRAIEVNRDRLVFAVLEGVANQVGRDLAEAIAVPLAGQLADRLQLDAPLRDAPPDVPVSRGRAPIRDPPARG